MITLKLIIDILTKMLLIASILLVGCLFVLITPDLSNKQYRSATEGKIFLLRNPDPSIRVIGTGFAIMAPSGKTYIMTNDHVCVSTSQNGSVLITLGKTFQTKGKVIANDMYSDLCLIESPLDVNGLKLSKSAPKIGDALVSIGHPRGMPLIIAQGEMVGQSDINAVFGQISSIDPYSRRESFVAEKYGGIRPEDCVGGKFSQAVRGDPITGIYTKSCIATTRDAYIATMPAHPGSSGSPVLNNSGFVVGVIFSKHLDTTAWGYAVSLNDLQRFLKNK